MEAVEMKDLEVGWWGCFDPLYGPERVLAITSYTLREPEGFGPYYGVGVNVLHLHVNDEHGENPSGRFIVRAEHEPVMAVSFPEAPVAVGADESRKTSNREETI